MRTKIFFPLKFLQYSTLNIRRYTECVNAVMINKNNFLKFKFLKSFFYKEIFQRGYK